MKLVEIDCPECGNHKGYIIPSYAFIAECTNCNHPCDVITIPEEVEFTVNS